MNFFNAVEKRYSHKERFLPDEVPPGVLESIATAGIKAPTGANRQLVHLVILPDRSAIDPLCALAPTSGMLTTPAAIAVLTDNRLTPKGHVNFEKEDYSAAVTQMLLAATAFGYTSLWLDSPYWDPEVNKKACAVLGEDEHYHLWAVLPIGLPDGSGTRREKFPYESRVFYRRFDAPAKRHSDEMDVI